MSFVETSKNLRLESERYLLADCLTKLGDYVENRLDLATVLDIRCTHHADHLDGDLSFTLDCFGSLYRHRNHCEIWSYSLDGTVFKIVVAWDDRFRFEKGPGPICGTRSQSARKQYPKIRHLELDLASLLQNLDGELKVSERAKTCRICHDFHPRHSFRLLDVFNNRRLSSCIFCALVRSGTPLYGLPVLENGNYANNEALVRVLDPTPGDISFTVNQGCYTLKEFGASHNDLQDDSLLRLTRHYRGADDLLNSPDRYSRSSLNCVSSWTVAKEQARSWIKDCTTQHRMCRTHEACILPTRVIHVGRSDSEVRLMESNENVGKYACLSHCWGQNPSIMLLRSNYQTFLEHIPWNDLQLTYQDALAWCRYLEIPYLWIDSLCIVQDDNQDWNRESVKMAAIYGCCYLTIAASAASNHDEGCRVKLPQNFCTYFEPNGAARRVAVALRDHGLVTGTPASSNPAPLLRRAWVLQELALSPRTLYFGISELNFECNSGLTCQCGQENKYRTNIPLPRDLLALQAYEIEPSWRALVDIYSGMRLSKPIDRLPAISGIALRTLERRHELGRSDQYLAGLWRSAFITDLGWYSLDQARPTRSYLAPSWSWVSHYGAVVHHTQFDDAVLVHTELLEAKLDHCVDDFGPLRGGFCVLKGPIIKLRQIEPSSKGEHIAYRLRLDRRRNITGSGQGSQDALSLLCLFTIGDKRIPPEKRFERFAFNSFWLVLEESGKDKDAASEGAITYKRVGCMYHYVADGLDGYYDLRLEDGVELVVKIV